MLSTLLMDLIYIENRIYRTDLFVLFQETIICDKYEFLCLTNRKKYVPNIVVPSL